MEIAELNPDAANAQVRTIRSYYQIHAGLYEATRWTFLFGRKRIIRALKLPLSSGKTILEVGCGTGHNLAALANGYPNIHLIGVDISPEMLRVASQKLKRHSRRVLFLEQPYAPGDWKLPAKPDAVLFSYCLTMINPGWESALQRASDDLGEGGMIAVVDFHGSPFGFFRRWMGYNHVRMDKHLLPALEARFTTVHTEVRQAYGGLWSYVLFVGRK
ncbi:MAG: class I SAM-dependent methyltransferase [Saprospiraceae bacterium]